MFTVLLDFQAEHFTGERRWLEIAVRPANTEAAFTLLTPRQEVTPVAYSLRSAKAGVAETASTATTVTGEVAGTLTWESVSAMAQQTDPNQGSIAANDDAEVVLTLPQNPEIGDLLRVSGVGAGGWKLRQNAGQLIRTDSLFNPLLPPENWTPWETERDWLGVASSADGSTLVAAVNDGRIYTSNDSGQTWTAPAEPQNLKAVASSADGIKLAAVAERDHIYTSNDSGETWVARDEIRDWTAIASSADGENLVAVARDDRIYTASLGPTVGEDGYLTGGSDTSVELQYTGDGVFVPLSHSGPLGSDVTPVPEVSGPPVSFEATGSDIAFTPRNIGIGTSDPKAAFQVVDSVITGDASNEASGENAFAAGGSEDLPNIASGRRSFVAGGSDNAASNTQAFVGGGAINAATGHSSFVGGGQNNTADGGASFVGGGLGIMANGGDVALSAVVGGQLNQATGSMAFIGGGKENAANGEAVFVAGGQGNTAEGAMSFVGAGEGNVASGDGAFVAGGGGNTAGGNSSFVGGGIGSIASGDASFVGAGFESEASGSGSFAAGSHARALHTSSFVWSDSTPTAFASTAADQFRIRATGGAEFKTGASGLKASSDSDTKEGAAVQAESQHSSGIAFYGHNASDDTTLLLINDGTGPVAKAYTSGLKVLEMQNDGDLAIRGSYLKLSERRAKTNIEPVETAEVLARVVQLPINTWNYKHQEPEHRHVGPMAEDFHAAFGLGTEDTALSVADLSGVALVAIQGLYSELRKRGAEVDRVTALNAENQERIEKQADEIAALAERNDRLEERLARLEKLLLKSEHLDSR